MTRQQLVRRSNDQVCYPEGDVESCLVPGMPSACDPRYVQEKGFTTFSLWSELDGDGSPLPETPERWTSVLLLSAQAPNAKQGGSAMFQIECWGWEMARVTEVAVAPLTPGVINGGSLRSTFPTELTSMSSRLKMQIQMHGSSNGSKRTFDIAGGYRLAISACQVTINVLYPRPGYRVSTAQEVQPTLGPGLVLDTNVGASISLCSTTPGQQVLTNTVTVRIPATVADYRVWIPEGTQRVSMYQTGVGVDILPEWRLLRSNTGIVGPSLGVIDPGTLNRIESVKRPGNAGMITMGPADPANDRIVTIVFELEI